MKRLTDIGFRKVGEWQIVNGTITPNLTDFSNSANTLYAFISNGEVLYVGKTTQPLKKRMYGYQNPGRKQNTNIKVNRLIHDLILKGRHIEIYALPDNGNHHVGAFHLNLAAGLEDSIISTLKPRWNESGK